MKNIEETLLIIRCALMKNLIMRKFLLIVVLSVCFVSRRSSAGDYSNRSNSGLLVDEQITAEIVQFIEPKVIKVEQWGAQKRFLEPSDIFPMLFDEITFRQSLIKNMKPKERCFNNLFVAWIDLSFNLKDSNGSIKIKRPLVGIDRIVTVSENRKYKPIDRKWNRDLKSIIANALEDASIAKGTKVKFIPIDDRKKSKIKRVRLMVRVPPYCYEVEEVWGVKNKRTTSILGTWKNLSTHKKIPSTRLSQVCTYLKNKTKKCDISFIIELLGQKTVVNKTTSEEWDLDNDTLTEKFIDSRTTSITVNDEKIPKEYHFYQMSKATDFKSYGDIVVQKVKINKETLEVNNVEKVVWDRLISIEGKYTEEESKDSIYKEEPKKYVQDLSPSSSKKYTEEESKDSIYKEEPKKPVQNHVQTRSNGILYTSVFSVGGMFSGVNLELTPPTSGDIADAAALSAIPATVPVGLELRLHYTRFMVNFGLEFAYNANGEWEELYPSNEDSNLPSGCENVIGTCPVDDMKTHTVVFNQTNFIGLGYLFGRDAATGLGPRAGLRAGWSSLPNAVTTTAHFGWTLPAPKMERINKRIQLVVDADFRIGATIGRSPSLLLVEDKDGNVPRAALTFGFTAGAGSTF